MDIGFGMGNLCRTLQTTDPYSHYSPLFPEREDFVKFLRNREYIQYRNVAESLPLPTDIPLGQALAQV
jgi:hypothetical protein